MDCPKCDQAMSFVPANQNWWCNPCLSTAEGEAPNGLAGPSVDEMANDPHNGPTDSGVEKTSSSGGWFDLVDLSEAGPLLVLVGGGVLIYTGHYIIGGILIACILAAGLLSD